MTLLSPKRPTYKIEKHLPKYLEIKDKLKKCSGRKVAINVILDPIVVFKVQLMIHACIFLGRWP